MRPLSVIARESMEPLRAVVRGRWRDERYGLRRKEGWVSRISDAKSRVQHLLHLSARIRSQVTRLGGPEGRVFKEKAKEGAKRMGIGAAVALFGAAVVAVAAVYILAVLILLVDIALDRLWLSALIVVVGAFIFGGAVAVVGLGIIRKGAREIPGVGGELAQEIKGTTEEMKETVGELQEIARQEAEERKKQMQEMMSYVKVAAPYVIGAYLGYRLVKGVVKARRARLLKLVKELEEA